MSASAIAHHRQVLVGLGDGVLRQRVILKGFDRSTGETTSVDKDFAFVAFNGHTIVGVVPDDQFDIARIADIEEKR